MFQIFGFEQIRRAVVLACLLVLSTFPLFSPAQTAANSVAEPASSVSATAVATNPEYDRIIGEAETKGVDVLEYALEKGKSDNFILGLDGYINSKLKQALIAEREKGKRLIEILIAKREEGKRLDEANSKSLVAINRLNIQIISLIEQKLKQGKFEKKDKDKLGELYFDKTTSDEVRELIIQKFGNLIDSAPKR